MKWLAAAAAAYVLYFLGMGSAGVMSADEPRYASIARDMAASGDWVTPRLWGAPWFEKPVLLYWMAAAAAIAGFTGETAARLPVAAVSVAFLVFYFLWIRRLLDERAAAFSTAVLALSAGWIGYSRVCVTDIPLSVAMGVALLLAAPWAVHGEKRWLGWAGAALGVAVLAKGLVPLVLSLPVIWIGRRRWRDLWLPLLACVLVAGPWYLLCYWRNGREFIDVFIWQHHFGRFLAPDLQHTRPWWFYIPVFAAGLLPWTPALGLLFRRGNRAEPLLRLLLVWLAFGFLFFSASRNKLPGYLLPLFPAAGAILGYQLSRPGRPRWILPVAGLMVAAVVPFLDNGLAKAIDAGLSRADIAPRATLALLVPLGVAWLEWRGRGDHAFAALAVGTVLCLAAVIPGAMRQLDSITARPLWQNQVASVQNEVCVEPWIRRTWIYGLNYYAGRALPNCETDSRRYRVEGIPETGAARVTTEPR